MLAVLFVLASLYSLLAERARRQEAKAQQAAELAAQAPRMATAAARLRSDFHPAQRSFCESRAKRRVAKCTRRAGKTRGGCRETMARCLESRQRWLYCAATRDEAKRRAWRSDTRDGWYDLLEWLGLKIARTSTEFERDLKCDVWVNKTELTIDFRNGSQLAIFAADRPEDADKLRGGEKDGVWVDEAQIFPSLAYFVDEVCDALTKKPAGMERGEVWLTGTPSRSLAGRFYELTKEPDQGPRADPGKWEIHEWSVVDNPYFGATAQERWDATAGAQLVEKNWNIDDPPPGFIREWLGRWTVGDALYVYAVHKRPPEEFAPCRVDRESGRYDHAAAVKDLPEYVLDEHENRLRIRWFYAVGFDFGFDPAAFAWVLWAFSPDVADVYEMGCWKRHRLVPDEIKAHAVALWKQVGEALAVCVGDAGGAMARSSIDGWRESTGLPIVPADKADKWTWIEHFNGELYGSNLHYRRDSALLAEQRQLQKKPGKPKLGETDVEVKMEEWPERMIDVGGGEMIRCGSDASDAGLYSLRHLIARRKEFARAPRTDAERVAREEKQMSDAVARQTARALRRGPEYDD